MGAEDVANALRAMGEDADAADRFSDGDFSGLPDNELTETERAMVIAAAAEVPEVSGFAAFLKLDGVDNKQDPYGWKVEEGEALHQATNYLKISGLKFP